MKSNLSDWNKIKIGNIAKILSGGTPDTINASYWNGNINWITPSEITKINKYIKQTTLKKISDKGLKNSSATLIPAGSIILCSRATIGECAINTFSITTNQGFKNLVPNKKILSEYLYYKILSMKKEFLRISSGSTFLEFSKKDLENLQFLLPPLPEQKRIVALLETWDRAIEKLEKKIELKKNVKKGLMQRLLTGKKSNNTKYGKWRTVKAGSLFINISKKNFPGEQLLSATQTNGIVPRESLEARVTMPQGSTETYKLVEPGNFVISLRSFQGGIEYSRVRGIVSPAYTVISSNSGIVDNFYRFYFKSYEFIERLNIAVFGIRDGKQISFDDFSQMDIPYPELNEQETIAKILSSAEEGIQFLHDKLQLLKDQKKYLLNQLVTGEIRTPEDLTIFSGTNEQEA